MDPLNPPVLQCLPKQEYTFKISQNEVIPELISFTKIKKGGHRLQDVAAIIRVTQFLFHSYYRS